MGFSGDSLSKATIHILIDKPSVVGVVRVHVVKKLPFLFSDECVIPSEGRTVTAPHQQASTTFPDQREHSTMNFSNKLEVSRSGTRTIVIQRVAFCRAR